MFLEPAVSLFLLKSAFNILLSLYLLKLAVQINCTTIGFLCIEGSLLFVKLHLFK